MGKRTVGASRRRRPLGYGQGWVRLDDCEVLVDFSDWMVVRGDALCFSERGILELTYVRPGSDGYPRWARGIDHCRKAFCMDLKRVVILGRVVDRR